MAKMRMLRLEPLVHPTPTQTGLALSECSLQRVLHSSPRREGQVGWHCPAALGAVST